MSVKELYEIEQANLLDQARKISLFSKHPPTVGAFREELLRNYLAKYTPRQLTVKSGFIGDYINSNNDELFEEQTRQIDFLVYDNQEDITFFETDNFAIVKPSTVFAAIEIKSTLTFYEKKCTSKANIKEFPLGGNTKTPFRLEGTLIDALKNIYSVANIAHKYNRKIFTGIFAFDANFDPMKIYEALDFQEIQRQLGIDKLELLPFAICVPGKFFVIIDAQDMFDIHGQAALGEGFCSLIRAEKEHPSLPLQFFTNLYYNNLRFFLNGKKPEGGGMFSISPGLCSIFSKHFDIT